MKKILISLMTVACLFWAGSALALPGLQLDIAGGVYDSATETIVSAGDSFTLYALLNLKAAGDEDLSSSISLENTFYISAALIKTDNSLPAFVEKKVPTWPTLGTFTFSGSTINVTEDMVYGIPPVDSEDSFHELSVVTEDLNDLGKHSIFPTYFKELDFRFYEDKKSAAYNTQDNPGGFTVGDALYYQDFVVDVGDLDPGYEIHFDLYAFDGKKLIKAPFSHDAQSGGGTPVPEPSTLLLLGAGLAGLGGFSRRFRK